MLRFIFLFIFIYAAALPVIHADAIDDLLSRKPMADPSQIALTRQLVNENPQDPRILELRYYLVGQLMGASSSPASQEELIQELKNISASATNKKDPMMAFKSRMRIGEIQKDILKDHSGAYATFKALESDVELPSAEKMETDYLRTLLYFNIAETAALAQPENYKHEMEIYSRLVLEYPYLDIPFDNEMYHRFYDLFSRAGFIYLSAAEGDLVKLSAVTIPPSQEILYETWKENLEKLASHEMVHANDMPSLSPEISVISAEGASKGDPTKIESSLMGAPPVPADVRSAEDQRDPGSDGPSAGSKLLVIVLLAVFALLLAAFYMLRNHGAQRRKG